jgi:murein L,D-transpeptidase YcbB/YkuD
MAVLSPLHRFAVAFVLTGALPGAAWAVPAATPAVAAALSQSSTLEGLLRGEGELRLAGRAVDRATLQAIYEKRAFRPIWEGEREVELRQVLDEAEAQGLDPAPFLIPDAAPAEQELLLTDAFLRYATALARGRVDPRTVEADWMMPAPRLDAVKVLDRALAGSVAKVLAELVPTRPAYDRLLAALERYRAYAKARSWRPLSLSLPLTRGDSGDAVRQLRQRLAAEDFIAPGDSADFDEALDDAVRRFQALHGLTVDGTVGRGTLAALNVSPAARVRQIRLNLERWRSLPHRWPATRVEVNVPEAVTTLFEAGEPVLTMRAIVGAPEHPTPVLHARMTGVLFNPPWNVPSSIIENEIRPLVKRDPGYLARNGFAYVEHNGGRQLEQLPGPNNALGQIKFEMPNLDDIYLHDTPARPLFAQRWRAVSHGCVRVEDPRGLASRVLAPSPEASPEAIDEAIASGVTESVPLPHSVPVYLLYWTAFVDADGAVEFRDDLYGRDGRLAHALNARDAAEHLAAVTPARAGY